MQSFLRVTRLLGRLSLFPELNYKKFEVGSSSMFGTFQTGG